MDGNGRLIVEATVTHVGEGPYYYPACGQCNSKLIDQTESFCPKCRKVYSASEVNQRYCVCLTISDGLSLAHVTAFGNILTPYFGCSATELHSKWRRRFNLQMESPLLKCALEKTLIGSSLLFGFKGVVRKPNGVRVTLKDVESLEQSSSSYLGRKKDLIAVQILPQNDSHIPVPAIQHLQKLDSFIQEHKESFDAMCSNYEYILHNVLLDDANKSNNSLEANGDRPSSFVECGSSKSYLEEDISNDFALSAGGSEISIDFSLTCSTQNSCNGTNDFYGSKCDNDKSTTALLTSKHDKNKVLNKSSTVFINSNNTSWCVKNWLRKQNNSSLNEARSLSKQSRICDASETQKGFLNSSKLFDSPEQPRREMYDKMSSPSCAFSNFSLAEIVSSPTECEKTIFKPCKNLSERNELNEPRQIGYPVKSNRRKYLTLKSYDSDKQCLNNVDCASLSVPEENIIDHNIFEENILKRTDSNCTNSNQSDSIIEKYQMSFVEIPESEELDLFIAGVADSENLGSNHSQCRLSSGIREIPTKKKVIPYSLLSCNQIETKCSDDTNANKSKGGLDKSGPIDCEKFTNIPDSEDSDLFLAAVNLEQLRLVGKEEEIQDTKEIRYEHSEVADSQNIASKHNSEKMKNQLPSMLSSSHVIETECVETCGANDNAHFSCQNNENTALSDDNDNNFDDSCDLFDSPANSPPQRSLDLFNEVTNTKNDMSVLSEEELNNSYSLFSSSQSSSSSEMIFPTGIEHSRDSDASHNNIDIFLSNKDTEHSRKSYASPNSDILQQQSYYDDSFMDLFSQPLKTPSRPKQSGCRRSCVNTAKKLFYSSASPDLFSSQEIEL